MRDECEMDISFWNSVIGNLVKQQNDALHNSHNLYKTQSKLVVKKEGNAASSLDVTPGDGLFCKVPFQKDKIVASTMVYIWTNPPMIKTLRKSQAKAHTHTCFQMM